MEYRLQNSFSHENLKTLEFILNSELNNLSNWLNSNKLTLNIMKTNFVIFCPYQNKLNYVPQISIFDNDKNKNDALDHKNCIKFLGLLIDENLSWKNHIHSPHNKNKQNCQFISEGKTYCLQLNPS